MTAPCSATSRPWWFAFDAEGNDNPILAAHLPGVQRHTVEGVSHWLMLDDPEAFNGALDETFR